MPTFFLDRTGSALLPGRMARVHSIQPLQPMGATVYHEVTTAKTAANSTQRSKI
jgi:hypothetical protein